MNDNLPPLPEPTRKQGQQMSYDGEDTVFFDCYSNLQMLAYGKECARAALAQAQSLPAVPEIDYQALIDAAYKRDRKWAQGTNGCIAFKHGAEWFRDQVEASPAQPVQPSEQAAFEDWLHRVCPSGDVTEVQRQWEASRELAEWLESQAKPVQPSDPWLPIETAPKDGTEIIMSNGKDVSAGSWFKGHDGTYDRDGAPNCDEKDACWMDWSGGMLPEPTHWMPLPPAPQPKD